MSPFLKRIFYRSAQFSGLNAISLNSSWRTRKLLILCYHGISLNDEHQFTPMYMPLDQFRHRLQRVRDLGCTVLPLGTAIEMLYQGTLPARSVVITFDDGFYDFYAGAWPCLRSFGFPATVYFTTYYSMYNVPVFDPMCEYVLWKARGRQLSWPELNLGPVTIDAATQVSLAREIKKIALRNRADGREKHELLRCLATRLDVDFDDLCTRRSFHLMTPAEATEIAAEGCDFQMHCHRHRVYRSKERFLNELKDNHDVLTSIAPCAPTHFCYPGGFRLPEYPGWLSEFGVVSATTCEPGLATAKSGPYELPRLLDSPGISLDEFSAWLSGVAHYIPRKKYPPAEGQLIEEPGY
jgi:peptidoglycan/xylan/chitin deacetylase (PgdA/CDA1 family)